MQNHDRGLGTTFERFSITRWLRHLVEHHPIDTVFEGPGDNVAGIPGIHSLPLAQAGCRVVVALASPAEIDLARQAWHAQGCLSRGELICAGAPPLPFPSRHFDLTWNFNRLPFLEPRALVAEMARLSRRYVALVVPNRHNYGFPARRLYHRRTGIPWPYGDPAVMDPKTVRRLLETAGLRVIETCWLDVPWWPDIIDPIAWCQAMLPAARRLLPVTRRDGYRWTPQNLPYFDPHTHAALHQRMQRLAWLERFCPPPLQTPFAHHLAILAETTNDAHR